MIILLRRRRGSRPRARTIRPAERYLALGAAEARRRGHAFIGTEHVLLVLVRDPHSGARKALGRLGVTPAAVEADLFAAGADHGVPAIDRDALATLGIDFDAVRERLEQTFGPGALEQTRAACLGIDPHLKLALAHALDAAGGDPLADEHILLGMLRVPDSLAARVLASRGVTPAAVDAVVGSQP